MPTQQDFEVRTLGPCRFASPLRRWRREGVPCEPFVDERTRVRYRQEVTPDRVPEDALSFEKAGPREQIFFEPAKTTAAVVTCGGLCPGLNNVIRSIYLELKHNYGLTRILGIRNGYMGLNPDSGLAPIVMTSDYVEEIHKLGGTVLGSSRGAQDVGVMVDFLANQRIDILFCIGGDGTQRGAHALGDEIRRRNLPVSIIGIPKTIDNDICFVEQTFGYATALEKAEEVLRGAHVEARGAPIGIGLVKLMGRDAGFIAAGATLASQEVNFVLVPEVPFPLEGDKGFLAVLERRMKARGHALIVVAEGAGQECFRPEDRQRDASGNLKPGDIGALLRERIVAHFEHIGMPVNLKYLDPSYLIRSVPANAWDRILSDRMARHAAHAAMAGKTDLLIGLWDNALIHVPIPTAVREKKHMDTSGDLWLSVLAATGQPMW